MTYARDMQKIQNNLHISNIFRTFAQNSYSMETQIKSLLNLDEIIKKKDNDNKVLDLKSLAESIMNEVCIFNGKHTYHPIEIEFYIYDKKNHADIHVYPRKAKVGDIFFHLSGMDICFESSFEEKEGTIRFGGILIRALEREDGKRFGGPLTCKDEVLNTAIMKCLVMSCEKLEKKVSENIHKRKGLENKGENDKFYNALYRFFRDDFYIKKRIIMEDDSFDFKDHKLNESHKRYYKIDD